MFSRFRSVFSGIVDTIKDTASSVKDAVLHPIQTVSNLWNGGNDTTPLEDSEPEAIEPDTTSSDDDIADDEDYSPISEPIDTVEGILSDYGYHTDLRDILDGYDATEGEKGYYETDYIIELNDGEEIYGSIRWYGDFEDITKAIIAKHGDLDSGDIAAVYLLEEA